MNGLPWFRMYVDFVEDPKMLSLAFEDQRHFIGVLALKAGGTLDQECAPALMNKIVAQKLWIDHSAIVEVKRRLVDARLIDTNWQPLAWNKRQFVSDHDPTNPERQRRFRESKKRKGKQAHDANNGGSNGDSNGCSNALRNATVTTLDTDTDTDTYTEETVTVVLEGGVGGTTPPAAPAEPELSAKPAESCAPPNGGSPPPDAKPAVKKADPKGTRLPEDWALPDDWAQWAVNHCADHGKRLDLPVEALKFANHFIAKPGQDGRKLDWRRTWQNWIMNARGQLYDADQQHSQRKLSAVERSARAEQRYYDRLARERAAAARPVDGSRVDAPGDYAAVEPNDGDLWPQVAHRLR